MKQISLLMIIVLVCFLACQENPVSTEEPANLLESPEEAFRSALEKGDADAIVGGLGNLPKGKVAEEEFHIVSPPDLYSFTFKAVHINDPNIPQFNSYYFGLGILWCHIKGGEWASYYEPMSTEDGKEPVIAEPQTGVAGPSRF